MNMIGWFEIYVDDMEKAKVFYQKVFQVELKELNSPGSEHGPGPEMWSFPQNFENYGASGAICKMQGMSPGGTGTIVYFSCEDCAEEESRVVEAGGSIMQSKVSLGDYGFMAMCKDPAGNMIGLHSMK